MDFVRIHIDQTFKQVVIYKLTEKFALFTLLLASISSFAQTNSEVKMLARPQQDQILLRWAPTKASTWQYANTYGYTLERYTILRDEVLLKPVEKVIIGAFKPYPEEKWEHKMEENDYAAVAAQAIYGETFELTQNYSSDIMQVINKTKELEQRYSFALFAADQSFEVAQMEGLAFTDTSAKKNEKYLYKVYANIPPSIDEVDSGTVYIGISDFAPLPEPLDFTADFGDGIVMLQWNREFFERVYNSFIVERSENNGKTFTKITEQPIVNTSPDETSRSRYYVKLDSITNYKKYVYRVKGITPFGETGPPSQTVDGEGTPQIHSKAQIVSHETDKANAVLLTWRFDQNIENLIEGFAIQRSNSPKGPFATISTIKQTSGRNYTDTSPLPTNYYRVGLITDSHEGNFSFPYLVQLEDSIPPAIPSGLLAKVDTTGVVRLTWNRNLEPDLLGYRVYRSNFKSAEYSQITSAPVDQSAIEDTISLKTLSSKIYYRVSSVDLRNNTSDFSEIIEVKKPDIVPPVPPVFSKVNAGQKGIELQWIGSSSGDVRYQSIYRKGQNEPKWILIARIENEDSTRYLDKTAVYMQPYLYTLTATDSSGLESSPSIPLTATKTERSAVKFDKLSYTIDRSKKQIELYWEAKWDEIPKAVLVYRSKDGAPFSLFRKVETVNEGFVDTELDLNTIYSYQVKAIFKDGSFSNWSDKVDVNY